MERLKTLLSKDICTVAFFDVVAKIIVAFSTIFLIKILSVPTYALYTKFNTASGLMSGVVGSSIATVYARSGTEYTSRGYNCLKQIYKFCLCVLGGATLLIFCFGGLLANAYSVTLPVIIAAMLYGGLQSLNKINQSFYQVNNKYDKAGMLENLKNIIQFTSFVILFLCAITIEEKLLFIIFILSVLIPVCFGIRKVVKHSDYDREKPTLGQREIHSMLSECGILMFYWLILNLIDQTDIILVNQLMDTNAVANYGVALKYYQLLLTMQASLITVFRIRTSKKEVVDNRDKQYKVVDEWIKKTWKFIILIFVAVNIVAEPVMTFLNGIEYINAIAAFRVFTVGAVISYLFAPNVAVMMAAKNHLLLCCYAIIGLLINVLIDVMLIPYFGIVAAALATVAGNAFLNMMSFVTIKRNRRIEL